MEVVNLEYSKFAEGQEVIISELLWEVFSEFEAPDYPAEGVETFKKIIEPQRIAAEVRDNGFKLHCCFDGGAIVGVIGFRSLSHLSMLFVKKSHHRKGIAKSLLEIGLQEIKELNPVIKEVTVNSSPYAVEIYKRLGFVSQADMQQRDGIIYMPMKLTL